MAPRIDPVPEGTVRPLWSVMIPVYNSGEYLKETLRSVLSQDPGSEEMEIEVVDNCSTEDDPEAIVREIGGGRVKFYRQSVNIGANENFNTCIRRSRGEWIHILHADDTVRPGLFLRARQAVMAHPEIGAVVCRVVYMDEYGTWLSLSEPEARTPSVLTDRFIERQLVTQRIQFAGMIVRRAAYEELGGFRSGFRYCADWDMWNRIIVRKSIFYDPELLACVRQHSGSETSQLVRTGANVADERLCIRTSIASADLSRGQARRIYRDAMTVAAIRAIRRTRHHWRNGDTVVALRQLRESFRCRFAVATVGLLYVYAMIMAR